MKLSTPLLQGKLIKRYKRFLADIRLNDNTIITALCPNTGSMKGCNDPGSTVFVSKSNNPKRKLKYTWEIVKANDTLVGINTHHPNHIVKEGITLGLIPELAGYDTIKMEKTFDRSRFDLYLESRDKKPLYIEVKNVTLKNGDCAQFPDAITKRGFRHLMHLMEIVNQGMKAAIFFLVQREDCSCFQPAYDIDPDFSNLLKKTMNHGVSALSYVARVSTSEIIIDRKLEIDLT